MATENKIPEIIKSSMENIRSMVDANTIIGDPVNATGGTVIIPISKVSVGIASGGVDYNAKDEATIAKILKAKWELGLRGGALIANPIPAEYEVSIDEEKAMYWLSNGAQPTDTVRSLLSQKGIMAKHAESKKEGK